MKIKNIMLFTYDFPHKKTESFLFRLLTEGYNIQYVIAAPRVNLPIPPSSIHYAPQHSGIMHPEKICQRFNIAYHVFPHNSSQAEKILKENPVDLNIIAGARILNEETILAANSRILNIHPGILPEVRGLDTLLWSIYQNLPIGISSHFISQKIDLGHLIYKEQLNIYQEDTMVDISLRLLEKQADVMMTSISMLKKQSVDNLENIDMKKIPYNSKMPESIEKIVVKKFERWKINHLNQK